MSSCIHCFYRKSVENDGLLKLTDFTIFLSRLDEGVVTIFYFSEQNFDFIQKFLTIKEKVVRYDNEWKYWNSETYHYSLIF